MALNAEILKANPQLATLTDEQIQAITTLSVNDENVVIGNKIGEVHGNYQRDAEEATGLKQPQGVKTYDWLKNNVFAQIKELPTLQEQIKTLQTEKSGLEKKLKDGVTDEALKQKITDAESQIANLQSQLQTEKSEFDKKLEDAQKQNTSILLEKEFDAALIGLQFKDDAVMPKEVKDAFIRSAKAEILAGNKADFIDDGKGGKQLVFRDDKGEIIRNKENALNPFTAKELLLSKISPIIEAGRGQQGGGAEPGKGGAGGGQGKTIDFTGVKTQSDATSLITKHLMDQGYARGTEEYAQKQQELYTENKINELPMR